jgi:hypothetical protein
MHTRALLFVAVPVLLAACGPLAAGSTTPLGPSPSPTVQETPGADLRAWTVSTTGSGPTATATKDGAVLLIPGNAQADSQAPHVVAVRLSSKCQLAADFDLQADYSVATWPAGNGVRFGLVVGEYHIVRTSNPRGLDNTYAANLAGYFLSVETHDTSGRLRLTRAGTSITASYLNKGTWVTIATANISAAKQPYAIAAWTDGDTFGRRDVELSVKNFSLSGPTTDCA